MLHSENRLEMQFFSTHDTFGRIDAVLNCVGVFDVDPIIVRASINKFHTVPEGFFSNILGSVYSSYYFSLLKGDQEGFILNVSPMISDEELVKLSKYFTIWENLKGYTTLVAEALAKSKTRFISISPSSIETQLSSISVTTKKSLTRALVMDSVIKRYNKHKEFVNLVLYAMTNSEITGVELELGAEKYKSPLMVARI